MNRRNYIILALIVFGGILFAWGLSRISSPVTQSTNPPVSPTPNNSISTGSQEASLQLPNVLVNVPESNGVQVQLQNGQGSNGGANVTMLPGLYTERPGDMGFDLFGVFTVNYGGSGVFSNVGLFQYFADAIVHQDSAPIGDRVIVKSIGTRNTTNPNAEYEVVVEYLDHGPNQAMAEIPNVPTTKVLYVKNHKFLPEASGQ